MADEGRLTTLETLSRRGNGRTVVTPKLEGILMLREPYTYSSFKIQVATIQWVVKVLCFMYEW